MTEILHAIGKKATLARKLWLMGLFGCSVSAFLMLNHVVTFLLGVPPLVAELATWSVWFAWQGWFFGRNRERYLRESPATAYRRALYRDIVPGAGCALAQMLMPATYGLRLPLPVAATAFSLVIAPLVTASGLSIMTLAFKTIGFGGAAFLNEFGYRGRDVSDWSIYKYVRHPLFLGAVLLSVGGASFFADPLCLWLALANILVLPIYGRIEDRRLLDLLGESYREYRERVGAFFPRLLPRTAPALESLTELDSEIAA